MNELKVIKEQEVLGKEFKIYGTVESPLFLAKDVATLLGNDTTQLKKMLNKVDEDEKVRNNITTLGGIQNTWFLTEQGLYELLMQSRKAIAKQFKKEVKNILKQIRQTGGYIPISAQETNEEFLARAFIIAQETLKKKELLLQQAQETITQKQVVIDNVINDNSLFALGTVGKILKPYCSEMGATKIFKFLRNKSILMNAEGTQRHNLPYDKYNKYFEMKCVQSYVGTYTKTYFNGKGLKWFLDKLAKEGYLTKEQKEEVQNKF